MFETTLDKIHIQHLVVRCIVGIQEWEQKTHQEVSISVTLHTDLAAAGRSDSIDDTVDYKSLKKRIMAHVEEGRFALIEKVAQDVADICLAHPRVKKVDVLVDKLGALRFAKSVAVEITREKAK